MSEFRDSVKGIVSNASCLTEGVDVPVVDMVAFMAPKRSRIDIVQAVGRAMRKAPGKNSGLCTGASLSGSETRTKASKTL